MSRRGFIGAGCGIVAGSTAGAEAPSAAANLGQRSFRNVVDLTHTLRPDFPTFSGKQQIKLNSLSEPRYGVNLNEWVVNEHTGTHIDAPIHFVRPGSDSNRVVTVDRIPMTQLVGPLVVVDIREKARGKADATLALDDLQAWESKHGRLPNGAIVALYSGWDEKAGGDGFRNPDDKGTMHFPGFELQAAEFLIQERDVKGLIVDTLSLDIGATGDFPVHYRWLGSNRWGVECAANLGQLPAAGAFVVVGAPKVQGASGGPARVVAFF